MERELEVLVELQEVDNKLMELEQSKGDLPQLVDELREKIESLKQDLTTHRSNLEECVRFKHRIEGEIDLQRQKLKKYQNQVYAVTTNKEYDAITSEIESVEKSIEDAEFNILELEEREETLSRQLKETEEELEQYEREFKLKEKVLIEKLEQIEKAERVLTQKRQQLVAKISMQTLGAYERIRKARDGKALAEVVNGSCRGCFSTIPAQRNQEIRRMDKIILCEMCGRILVWGKSTGDEGSMMEQRAAG